MTTVTIVGGHGKVALRTTPLLHDAGYMVRSVIRAEAQSANVSAAGAVPVIADVEELDTDAISDLLDGTDVVIWSAGAGGGGDERTWAVDRDAAIRTMDAAGRAGVQRFIMVSYLNSRLVDGVAPITETDAELPAPAAYYNAKSEADEHLRTATDLDWTVLGPSVLSLEPGSGGITLVTDAGTRDVDVPKTSRENVAQTLVAVIDNPTTAGRTFNFHDGDTPIAQAVA